MEKRAAGGALASTAHRENWFLHRSIQVPVVLYTGRPPWLRPGWPNLLPQAIRGIRGVSFALQSGHALGPVAVGNYQQRLLCLHEFDLLPAGRGGSQAGPVGGRSCGAAWFPVSLIVLLLQEVL